MSEVEAKVVPPSVERQTPPVAAPIKTRLAFDGETAIGYAVFYPNFSTFRGQRGIYLEDIYITKIARGKGVGEMMLRHIAKLGKERGFERIDFLVLEWNTPAVQFYKKLGAVRDEEERHFKFTDEAFQKLAKS